MKKKQIKKQQKEFINLIRKIDNRQFKSICRILAEEIKKDNNQTLKTKE